MKIFRISLINIISMVSLIVVLSTTIMTNSIAAADATFTSALWVAEDNGVLKVTTSNGNILFEIPDLGRVDSVATDGQRGRLWVATQTSIKVYNFAGEALFTLPTPFTVVSEAADNIMMLVDEDEGSVWLTNQVELIKLDNAAAVSISQVYTNGVNSFSFDSQNRRVWLSHSDSVSSIDATTGVLVSSFSSPPDGELVVDKIHYDKNLNELWLLGDAELSRYDITGNKIFTSSIAPLKDFVLDGQGKVWASEANNLFYISAVDSIIFQVSPYPDKEIMYLVVNPTDQSVWVANDQEIVNYTSQGIEQHRLNALNEITGLAIYSDVNAPTLSIVSPVTGTLTNNSSPSFVFNLADVGVGANSDTIELVSNNQIIATSCLYDDVTKNATCSLTQTLTDGLWDFTATVKDYIGNESQKTSTSFTVDTISPAITVNSHLNGAYVNQSAQALSGYLSEFASLDINGISVALELNHTFIYSVLLLEGQNNFLLTAEDQATNVGTFPFVLFLDSIPPAAANVDSIIVTDSINGESTLTGQVGAVEADAIVEVTNLTTNVVTTIQANADGSFSLVVQAIPNDTLNIVVIDKAGNRSELRVIELTPPLSISITSPVDLSSVQSDSINVEGTFKGPMNSGVTINGQAASVSPDGDFVLNDFALSKGINNLKVILTTLDGSLVTKEILVNSDGQTIPFKFEPSFSSGPAPFNIELEFTWYNKELIQKIEVDYEGDGIIDFTTNKEQESFTTTYIQPGIYHPSITVTTDIEVYQKEIVILVQSRESMIQMFTANWNGMNNALVQGDINTALSYMDGFGKKQYGPVFEVLKDKMPQIVQSYSQPQGVLITNSVGELAINRLYQGQNRIYFIYFMRDKDGLWKLHNM